MGEDVQNIEARLGSLGLSDAESTAYLTILRSGALTSNEVATRAGLARSTTFAALKALVERGLVSAGAGYGKRYRVLPPEEALPSLVEREREVVHEHERIAKELLAELEELGAEAGSAPPEVVEILRDRRSVADRFSRLLLQAEREVLVLVKAPILVHSQGVNDDEERSLRRGVVHRAIYEQEALEADLVMEHLEAMNAAGEHPRLYRGSLPLKVAIFDREAALLPLETPSDRHPVTSLLIRHPVLCGALRVLFEYLWSDSEEIAP